MTQASPDKAALTLTVEVDDEHLRNTEEQAFQILYQQRHQFNLRWQTSRAVIRVKAVARWIAVMLSVIGFLLCLALLIAGHSWQGASWPLVACLLLFLAIGVLAYRLPDFEPALERWTDRVSRNSCRKVARRCVKGAHQLTPFNARYEVSAGHITYHRDQPEKPGEPVWTRPITGHALIADHLTILVKKPRSLHPRVVILLPPTADWLGCLANHKVNHKRSAYGS